MRLDQKARSFVRGLVTRTLDFEFESMPYRLSGVSSAKLISAALAEFRPLSLQPPWPSQLQIEVSAVCTLRCPLCASVRATEDLRHGLMEAGTMRSIVQEAGGRALIAILWMWGEPLLHPGFPELVSIAREAGLATVTSTNGQHVQTPEEAEALVASGLDNLIVAIDEATEESFGRYRVGGSLEKAVRCLDLISEAKRSLGSRSPGVNVRTVVMKQNEGQIPLIERLAAEHGADMFSTKLSCLPGSDEDPNAPDSARYRTFAPAGNTGGCRRPWTRMSVTWDGCVIPCEFDFKRTRPFGLVRGGALNAWRSRAATDFRSAFAGSNARNGFCADCGYRGHKPTECMVELKHL